MQIDRKGRQKKILLFTRPLAPPWDEASKNLAFEIAKNSSGNFEFQLLTTKKFSNELTRLTSNFPAKKVTADAIFADVSMGWKEQMALFGKLVMLGKSVGIIHLLFTPRKLTSFLIRTKLKLSKAKTIQTIATIRDEFFLKKDSLRKIFFADMIVAQSFTTRNKLIRAGIGNVSLIYPGIDLEKFAPAPKDSHFLKKAGLKKDDFIVLYAGEYSRLEAMENILGALEKIVENGQLEGKMKLVMACRIKTKKDDLIKEQFVEKIKQKGYDKNVVFFDFCGEMPKLYNAADVQVFPVRKMAGKFDIPFVLIEQMACKKPVIISDLDVLKEFVKDKENGIVVDRTSPRQLARAIQELFMDKQEALRLGENALVYVRKNFDIKENVKKYEKIYNKL